MRRTLMLILTPLALLSCAEVTTPGQLTVSWWMQGLSCQEAGVERVEAALYAFDDVEPSARLERACEGSGLALEGVQPGDYSLILRGFDAEGCWVFEGREEAVVIEAREEALVQNLTFTPRSPPLRVSWGLDASGCAAQGVDQVRVEINEEERWHEQFFLCQGGARTISFQPHRAALTITLQGLDMRGNIITRAEGRYEAAVFEASSCLEVIEIELPLCVEGECRAGA
ncbi:hypothetical protein KKF91_05110 [Myxococcota bacterium]|nr:hypothetical protein [Myxococcota bacterium]